MNVEEGSDKCKTIAVNERLKYDLSISYGYFTSMCLDLHQNLR